MINQGAAWEAAAPTNVAIVTLAPTAGWTTVSGDSAKFREHYWQPDGPNGGLERIDIYKQVDPDTRLFAAGHLSLDDYKLVVGKDRNDLGFVHVGWEQFRQFYDDAGGTFATEGNAPERLGEDLHLDAGKTWVDLGLTVPNWPRLVLGYEYDYKNGPEAITSWGAETTSKGPRNLAPASKYLDEGTHILKFDVNAEVQGITIEDRFRGEFYGLNTHYTNVAARSSMSQNASDADRYFQGANSIRLEKRLADWLSGSAGYFFSRLDGNESFSDVTQEGGVVYAASVPNIVLERESQVANATGLVGPFEGLTFSTGFEGQWTSQQAGGSGSLNHIAYALPPANNLALTPAILASDYEQETFSETLGLRYSKLPFTSVFADARLQQGDDPAERAKPRVGRRRVFEGLPASAGGWPTCGPASAPRRGGASP